MAWSRPDGVRGGHLDLAAELKWLDGKGYKAYKDLGGGWELPLETSTAKISCILFMDHVQGDPYAAPSRMRLRISRKDSAIPTETTENRARRSFQPSGPPPALDSLPKPRGVRDSP